MLAGFFVVFRFEGAFLVLPDGFAGADFLAGDGFFFDTVVRLLII